MKWQFRYMVILISSLLLVALGFVLWTSTQKKILRIGVYAGSSWDVPNSRENRILDNIIRQLKSHIRKLEWSMRVVFLRKITMAG